MSTSKLSKPRLARMHDVLASHVQRGEMPGLVALVSRHGETHVDAIGTTAVDGDKPMQRDAIFRIASMTKPVTAVASMILVEECKLRLDEPVDVWLPEMADRTVLKRLDGLLDDTLPAHRPITARDLLTLRMGFGHILEPASEWPIQKAIDALDLSTDTNPARQVGPDEWIRRLGTLPLMHQPGEGWMYDTGLDVLGVLIARIAGQPLDVFFRERIFEPLDMKDTSFSVPANKLGRLPACYEADDTGTLALFDDAQNSRWRTPPAFPQATGGLVSTVDDYLLFGQMLLNKGKLSATRILSRPSVELMTANHLTSEQQASGSLLLDGRGWGFGMAVTTERDQIFATPGRYGWEGGHGTSFAADPREEMVGILMTQVGYPQAMNVYFDFWTSAYQAIDD